MSHCTKSPIGISLVCICVFILSELFGWKYIGPLSLRHYSILFIFSFLLIYNVRPKKGVFICFKYLIVYFAYVAVLGLFNDLYTDNKGVTLIFARFVPTIAVFILITSTITLHKSKLYFVYFLLFVLGIDAIATILQGTGNVLGWVISQYFSNSELIESAVDSEGSIGASITCGIMGTVVGNGYFLLTIGLLFWVPYVENKTKSTLILSFAIWSICLVALFYNQQRLAFYAFLLFSLFIPVLLARSKVKTFFMVFFLLFVVFFSFYFISSNTFDFGRLSSVTNQDLSERHMAWRVYYQQFMPDHFITGDRHLFNAIYGQTPHNMIIETMLLGGIGGLAIYFFFIVSVFRRTWRSFNHKKIIACLYALPIFAMVLVSWEHSSGFHTGITLGAYLLALFELTLVDNSNLYNRRNGTIK